MTDTRFLAAPLLALMLLSPAHAADKPGDKPEDFTFLFWTDQEINHDAKDANFARLAPTIDAMNFVAGRKYPAAIGGTVAKPDFVASGGDTTGWPTNFCVYNVWDDVVKRRLKFETRPVAGNHDSGGKAPSETFYGWLRKSPFVKKHASDNGQPAWKPPDAKSGIIPGVSYSFRHKGVVFVMWTPTYDLSGDSPAGSSPIYEHDLKWLRAELAKYDPKDLKIMVCHYNYGSILNRAEVDAIYAKHNVVLHLCGHWEKIQHWRGKITDYVMDSGCRARDSSFSVVRVARDRLTLAHYRAEKGAWSSQTIVRMIPARWTRKAAGRP